jgi:hypothetical protein
VRAPQERQLLSQQGCARRAAGVAETLVALGQPEQRG